MVDLQQFGTVLRSLGWTVAEHLYDGCLMFLLPGARFGQWSLYDGKIEDGRLAFAWREAVITAVLALDGRALTEAEHKTYSRVMDWLHLPLRMFNTDGAAKALMALNEAGLLSVEGEDA